MKELDVAAQKKIVLDILKYVHEICEKNNIRYFAGYGTALGAVRHQGFIPWDDDGDIEVPWPDYLKLMEIINSDESHYRFLSFGQKGYYYCYGKIIDTRTVVSASARKVQIEGLGVDVDVFPLVGFDRKEEQQAFRKLQAMKMIGVNYANDAVRLRKNFLIYPVEKGLQLYYKKKGIEAWGRKLENMLNRYPFDRGEVVFSYGGLYKKRQLFDRHVYDSYELMNFEDGKLRVCADWDGYLTHMYGDWRQLPDEDKRKAEHVSRAFWREDTEEDAGNDD